MVSEINSKLDLHGIRHADAERAICKFIEQHYNYGRLLTIVTGNSEPMKKIVDDCLELYGLEKNDLQLSETRIVFKS